MSKSILGLLLILGCSFFADPQALYSDTKLLLVTGCGRSGTTFTSQFLTKCGLDIPHEKPGKDGCVSWPMTANFYSPWGPYAENEQFDHIFQQVRNPLDVMSSFYTNIPDLSRDEWHFIRMFVPQISLNDTLLVHCAKYWYYWNLFAEKRSEWRYRIEDFENILDEFQSRIGVALDKNQLKATPNAVNHWLPIENRITWKDLKMGIPEDLFIKVQEMSKRYGYPIED